MKRAFYSVLVLSLFVGCGKLPAPNDDVSRVVEDLGVDDDVFSFLVIGDFGRNGYYGQTEVAQMMDQAAHHLDIEFVVTTGDNFYDNGVASVNDPLIQSSFEDVYTGSSLLVDWWVSLGNHEYRGNVQALIDYSEVSRRWNLPARYYSKTFDGEENGQIDLFVLDTSPLNAPYYSEAKYSAVALEDSSAQLKWLDTALASSEADWKIVIGHHPLLTGGKRADEPRDVSERLQPILARHQVDAYFAGHEHDLQHLVSSRGTNVFISGAGSEIRPTGTIPETKFAEARNGFMAVSIDSMAMTVNVIDKDGAVRYKTSLPRKR
jgi:tartrate-resistant acid phosphatase type 5